MLKLRLKVNNEDKCLNYNDKYVIKYLLQNLKSSKHLNVEEFIYPKQLMANCWFNTLYMIFFISDKGRKFFKFFRQFMITGKTISLKKCKLLNQRYNSQKSIKSKKVHNRNEISNFS